MRTACLVLIVLVMASNSALAQTADHPRRMYPTQDGFLEVDGRTGAITDCRRTIEGYRCTPVNEVEALPRDEGGPKGQAPGPQNQPPAAPRQVAPTDQEIERALDVMERFLRRFMGIIWGQRPERT